MGNLETTLTAFATKVGEDMATLAAQDSVDVSFLYATKANMTANTTSPDGTGAIVAADTTAANNGVYVRASGAWTKVVGLMPIINVACSVPASVTPKIGLVIGPDALLTLATSVTLDFSVAQPAVLGENRKFSLGTSASVTNLRRSNLGWFAGHLAGTTTDATSLMQAWADSVSQGGECSIPAGTFSSAGTTAVLFTKGQRVVGAGRSASIISFTGVVTAGFKFTTVSQPSISHVRFQKANDLTVPTGGSALDFQVAQWNADNIAIMGCNGGVYATALGKLRAFDINDCRQFGINLVNHADTYCADGVITATSSFVTLGSRTGTFINGETVTWSGGSAVTFTDTAGINHKTIFGGPVPAVGTVLTGQSSGAKGTITALQHAHVDGGIEIFGNNEAHLFTNIDVVGGRIGLNCATSTDTLGQRPMGMKFTNCLFDSAHLAGVFINVAMNIKFTNCFFSNRAESDVYILKGYGIEFHACDWINSWGRAILVDAGGASQVSVFGGTITDFNVSNGGWPAVAVGAASAVLLNGLRVLTTKGFSGHYVTGLKIESGAFVTAVDCDFSACSTPINDLGGTNTVLERNKGYRTYNRGIQKVAVGQSSVTFNHGLNITPADAYALLGEIKSRAASGISSVWVDSITSTQVTVKTNANVAGADYWFYWQIRDKDAY